MFRAEIRRRLDAYQPPASPTVARAVIVLMDTTYWGRDFGLMLFKDTITRENLLWYYVRTELNTLYLQGITELQSRGFKILGIVCDGITGLLALFPCISVQMCQFHQVAIVRRYLTKSPKLQAPQALLQVVYMMKHSDKKSFISALEMWFAKWKEFLNERTINTEKEVVLYA